MTVEAPPVRTSADLRARRAELGLTLEEVARQAGVAFSTVVRTEGREYRQRDSAARVRIEAVLFGPAAS